ncbi:uncharacterized protein LOC128184637 isoform X2 [Crassostrea angulata]|uniref:uncharacterized protein LOC128184637 isoform X2 n=1 Tax=Magallana angulata TaxID=2784310 RepID=UPI0022B1DA91|nr:uncharacterized protein LOC128184637 isoform X2 [Crassostrea angulata]
MSSKNVPSILLSFLLLAVLVSCANIGLTTTNHKTTTHVTTPRPTPEKFEYTNLWYRYDSVSHFMCSSHATRLMRVCLCYHVPYEEQHLLQDSGKLQEVEERILRLYLDGHTTPMSDLRFYSDGNYQMCTGHGHNLDTTILRVYD